MSFTRMTQEVNNISQLADRPNDAGMNAAQLKAAFDAAGVDIKAFINAFLDELEAANAAGNIGISPITGLTAANIQAALAALYAAMQDIAVGTIPDLSLDTIKYKDRSVTGDKVAIETLVTENYAKRSVTGMRINKNTIEEVNYRDRSVTSPKIAEGGVDTVNLAPQAVTQPKMATDSVGTNQIINGSVTPDKTTDIQRQHRTATVIIPAITTAGGSQTVNVANVTASNTVLVSPEEGSWEVWRDCGVRCSGQGAGTLTFTAESATNAQIEANALILD